jgi:hypothetical protein
MFKRHPHFTATVAINETFISLVQPLWLNPKSCMPTQHMAMTDHCRAAERQTKTAFSRTVGVQKEH